MMRVFQLAVACVVVVVAAGQVQAAPIFIGSWDVYDPAAPEWSSVPPNGPLAYTGQEAAALLFGGSPGDYSISTIDSNPANINNMAWYDTIGIGGSIQAENWNVKYLGLYYGPTSGFSGGIGVAASSAFIRDNLAGQTTVNFAFQNDTTVPEPTSIALLATGALGFIGYGWRRKRKLAA